jgi:hypothetical protein
VHRVSARPPAGALETILALQATAGNLAVGSVLQRAPAKSAHASGANLAEMKGEAAMLAMHISGFFGPSGQKYGPADLAGFPPADAAFLQRLYEVMFNRRFGGSDPYDLPALDREADLARLRDLLPSIEAKLALDPLGLTLVDKLHGTLNRSASDITYSAIMVRARSDAELQAHLLSRPVTEARAEITAALQQGWKSYSKFADIVEKTGAVATRSSAVGAALHASHLGLDNISKIVKAVDPESYRKAVAEAREWCEEHHAGVVMGTLRAFQVEAEMIELTVGTLNSVVKTVAGAGTLLLAPGHNLTKTVSETVQMLEEMEKAGGLEKTSGKLALKLGKVAEKLEKVEVALGVISVASGIAKAVTADTTGEKVDAGVDILGGSLQVGGKVLSKVAGREALGAALGSAASSVLITWEMVKFFGNMGLDAIEGSMWGGLQQELTEIQEKGDRVAVALVSLGRAVDERNARFTEVNMSPERAGADEAVDKLAYDFQKELKAADRRWREAHIPALGRAYPRPTQQSVAVALQDGYPADIVAQTGIEFMQALADAYRYAPDIVDEMLVDQGYLKPEQAVKRGKERAKQRAEAAGGTKKEE